MSQHDELESLRAEVARLRARLAAVEQAPPVGAEARLSALLNGLPAVVFTVDGTGTLTMCEGAILPRLGVSPERVVGHSIRDLVEIECATGERIGLWQACQKALTGETVAGVTLYGGYAFETRLVPVHEAGPDAGRITSVLGVSVDITHQRSAERRLRQLLESDLVGMLTLERDGQVSWANALTLSWTGLELAPVEAGAIHWHQLVPPEQHAAVRSVLEQLWATGHMPPIETECVATDGRRRPVLMSGAGLDTNTQRCTLVLVDVSERRQAEAELARTSEILDGLVSASPAAIFALDAEGRVELWNPAAEWLLGWPRSEVLGRPLPLKMHWRDEERPSGPARDAFASDVVVCTLPDGAELEMLLSTAPRTDARGHVVGTTAILIDISEQRRLEARLAEGQKMEAIGRLAGGVAHDLNNVLTAVHGFADLLADSLDPGDPRHDDVEEILRAAERAAGLTRQLLAFARRQVLEPTLLEPDLVVRGLEPMLRRVMPADIDLRVVTCAPDCRIHVDRIQLEQVLLNLVLNARDAMPEGGTLALESTMGWLDASAAHDAPRGACCAIVVRDTGHGMEEDVLEHIFEPFFTTRSLGEGTGLGLATVHGIVRQSGGSIEVESTPGRGTTFRVFFPAADPSVTPAGPTADGPLRRPRSGVHEAFQCSVLLVEDEDAVRRLTARLLRTNGYTVHEAASVDEARHLALETGLQLDLLLSDVVLQDGDGVTLARELGTARPGLGVLLMSGYPGGRKNAATTPLDPQMPLIHKPFTVGELLEQLRLTEARRRA